MSELAKAIEYAASDEALKRETARQFGSAAKAKLHQCFPIDKLNAPDNENHRFASGQVVAGVTLKSDHRNIPGMADEIRRLQGIQTPLVACERPDGTVWLKQGFRRLNGAKKVIADNPTSPLAIVLAQGIPVLVYSGLTEAQEKTLINDQTSKPFSCAEVFLIFRDELSGGRAWLNICESMYQQIGAVTGRLDKVREIDAITDPQKRIKELRDWCLGTVAQGWVKGLMSGQRVENLWVQTFLWKDKYEGAGRPEVVMDLTRQKKLTAAIIADTAAQEGELNNGPRMNALLAEFAAIDAALYNVDGTKKKKDKDATAPAIRPLTDLQDMITREEGAAQKPNLLSRVLRILLKGGGDTEAMRLVRNFDRCREVFATHREYLPLSLKNALGLVMDGVDGSENTFAQLCLDNYPAPEVAATPTFLIDATPDATVQPTEGAPDEFNLVNDTTTVHSGGNKVASNKKKTTK
jgi:hypothetical protein